MDTPFSSEGGSSEPPSLVVWVILLVCLALAFQIFAPVLAVLAAIIGILAPLLPLLLLAGVVLYLVQR